MHTFMMLQMKDANLTPEFIHKRLGTSSSEAEAKRKLEWWCSSQKGDVRFGPRPGYGVHTPKGKAGITMHHSFGNTAVVGEFLTPGTTHVAVGFTDLSGVAAAVLQWEERGARARGGRSGVLRWVGYEASPVSVAKALVVTSMMLEGEPEEAVLQVGGWCGVVPLCAGLAVHVHADMLYVSSNQQQKHSGWASPCKCSPSNTRVQLAACLCTCACLLAKGCAHGPASFQQPWDTLLTQTPS
jgi:hypothetical protein